MNRVKKHCALLFLLAIGGCCSGVYAQTAYFVSPGGNDNNTGTKKAPFKSIEKAQSKAREAKGEVTVYLRGGIYRIDQPVVLTSEDGNDAKQLTIRSYPGEQAIISGGIQITPRWQPYMNGIMKSEINPRISMDMLTVNGEIRHMARYPDYDPDAVRFNGTSADATSKERVDTWTNPAGGYLHVMHGSDWGDFHYRITGKDHEGNLQMEGGHQNNRQSGLSRENRMVENIFEELDAPGEWYYNSNESVLYYYPLPDEEIQTAVFEVPQLKHLIEFRGREQDPVKNITVKEVELTQTVRTFMEKYEPLLRSDWTVYRGGAVFFEGTENCKLESCSLYNLGGNAVFFSKYNRRSAVSGSHFTRIGASAICFVGDPAAVRSPSFEYGQYVPLTEMDRRPGPQTNNYPADCSVYDNLIHKIGLFEKQITGVELSMCCSITVSHNSIYDVPRAGINVSEGTWGGHIIEYNDVFETVKETGDHGSFNSWGRDRFWHPDLGRMREIAGQEPGLIGADVVSTIVIRNNRFRCDRGWDIDLDDGSGNYRIYNNLCLNGGIKLREGFYRIVENNILINNTFHPHVWFERSGDVFARNIVMAPYRPIDVSQWGAETDYNIFTDSLAYTEARKNKTDEHSIVYLVRFEDPEKGDYRITADATKVFRTGFLNFDMDKFGVVSPSLKKIAKTPVMSMPVMMSGNGESEMTEWQGLSIKNLETLGERSATGMDSERGVYVVTIIKYDSPMRDFLQPNDVILELGGKSVENLDDLHEAMKQADLRQPLEMVIFRNQKKNTITVPALSAGTGVKATAKTLSVWGLDTKLDEQSALSLEGTDIYNGLRSVSFNEGWRFHKGEVADGQDVNAADHMWQTVTLPHDWAIFNEFDPNALSGGDGGYLDGGVGWYRKTFTVPDNLEGKQILIGFDGISELAKVWINGHYIAFRPNGYSTFQCDLTPWINYKGENVIAVRAHKDDKAARWYTGAGIYRNVWLTALNPVHIDYCGMYVTTPVITYNTALVKVETTVLNKFSTDKSVSLEVTVLNDGGGVTGKTVSSPARVSASGESVFTNEIMLNNPEKWRTYDPRLYVVRADVIVDGEVVDTYKTTLGIREIKFDSEKGFTLNGESMKFNGVCMHSDLGCLGAAVNYRAIERQLQIMKRMGVNAIRTAHNFPDPQVLELCDRLGIMVVNEAFDVWRAAKNGSKDYSLYFAETLGGSAPEIKWKNPEMTWAESDIRDWVKRDRNHPSVIMWSIGNEILPEEPNMIEDATNLKKWIKEVDPGIFNEAPDGRPVTWGNNQHGNANKRFVSKNVVDIDGINYQNRKDQPHISYDIIRNDRPDQPLFASETCSNVRSRGIYKFPVGDTRGVGGYPDFQASSYGDGNWLPLARESYASMFTDPYMMGEFVWTGFDYIGEPSPYGWGFQGRSSYFGIVDLAGFPKDIFYFYKSRWQNEPVLHLLPHWNWGDGALPDSQNGVVDVFAYTNCQKVELFLNGKSLGEKQSGNIHDPNWEMRWRVPWEPGVLEAKGVTKDGKPIDCRIVTAGTPAGLEVKPDRTEIEADGKDLVFVEVDVMDGEGNFVPTATDQVEFTVSGPGVIVGVDNGDATGKQNLKGSGIKAFSGKCLVVIQSIKNEEGTITVTANSNGLTSGRATLKTAVSN